MNKVEKIKKKIDSLYAEIGRIQDKCQHPTKHVSNKPRANTDNWRKQDDRYWYDYRCDVCDKIWEEDQK